MIPTPRTARFIRAYLRNGAGPFREEEVRIAVGGEAREATLYLPLRRRPSPAWVVLHGLTVPGRHHLAMGRFVRSLAASGAVVLVPDIPAWRRLRVDESSTRDTLLGAAEYLAGRPEARPGGVGAVGFSFGATQALIALAEPRVRAAVKALVGFGGYADLGREVRYLFTGEHEWDGVAFRGAPDPYGLWIMAGNYLTRVPGYEGMGAVAEAALALALESGRRGTWAWEPEYDPLKAAVRERLSPEEREVWEMVAPPAGRTAVEVRPDALELVERFATTMARDPFLDPRPHLGATDARVVLSHGRADRLIPFTETLRLRAWAPEDADVSAVVTGLLAHSGHAGWMHPIARAREAGVFIRLLNRALALV
jgi:hypothetical protein